GMLLEEAGMKTGTGGSRCCSSGRDDGRQAGPGDPEVAPGVRGREVEADAAGAEEVDHEVTDEHRSARGGARPEHKRSPASYWECLCDENERVVAGVGVAHDRVPDGAARRGAEHHLVAGPVLDGEESK